MPNDSRGVRETVRRCRYLLRQEKLWRWILVILLAILVTVVEATGAVAVFLLIGLIVAPDAPITLPIVGSLEDFAGDIPREDLIISLAIGVAGFFILRAIVIMVQLYAQDRLGQNAGARLSTRLFDAYLRMPYVLHAGRNSAELIRNAYDSVRALTNELLMPTVRLIASAAMAVGMFVVLLVAAPVASLLALGVISPLVLVLLRVIQPRLKRLGRKRQAVSRDALKILQQSLHGIREVLLFGRASYFRGRFERQQHRAARIAYMNRVYQEIPRALLETGLVFLIAAFFVVTVLADGSPEEALAVLGLFAYTAQRLQPSIHKIISSLNSIRFAGEAIDNIYDDLYMVESIPIQDAGSSALPSTSAGPRRIELEHVSFSYPGSSVPALRDVSLSISPGESIGVVGPTGGGKSTFVDLLTGLLEPSSGVVRIDSLDLRTCTTSWQREIGVVPQTVFLIDDTFRRNIALGFSDGEIDDARVHDAVGMAQLSAFVSALPDGLNTVVGERGVRLSGGQRQRVAIARALYRQPSVVIFDEGTSALDNATEADLLEAMRSLRGGHTIVAVAHRISTVQDCDRIIVVDEGRIVDIGTFESLIERNAKFRRIAGRVS